MTKSPLLVITSEIRFFILCTRFVAKFFGKAFHFPLIPKTNDMSVRRFFFLLNSSGRASTRFQLDLNLLILMVTEFDGSHVSISIYLQVWTCVSGH